MISLTDEAIGKVKQVLSEQENPENFQGIRVSVVGGGCSGFQYAMKLEKSGADGDEVLDVDSFHVFVDQQSMLYLAGTEIDYIETPQGAGFKFNNPNVSGSCGCGESFKV